MALSPPPGAPVSPDGRWWWDGAAWQPVPSPGAPPPPPAAAAPPRPYRTASLLGLGAVIGVGAVTVLDAADIFIDGYGISVYSAVGPGGLTVSQADVQYGVPILIWLVLFYLAFIPTVVFWCLWEHRAAANLPALGGRELRFRPGWAVGWWFIPFANLIRPYQVLVEIWKASEPGLDETGKAQRDATPAPRLLGAWWAAWIVGNVIANFANRASAGAHDGPGNVTALAFDLVGQVVLVAAGVLAVLVVKRTDARQVAKAQRLGLAG